MSLLEISSISYSFWLKNTFSIIFSLSTIKKKQQIITHFSLITPRTLPSLRKISPIGRRLHAWNYPVIQSPNEGESIYVYHLPDDTNCDSVLTFSIYRDIIHHHLWFFILHSDNCQEQYKCKFIFFEMKKIIMEFGCKQELHHKIITSDSWFLTTRCNFSRNIFQPKVVKSITVWMLLTLLNWEPKVRICAEAM